MYEYQQSNRYFAQAAEDIKEIVGQELQQLGATDVSSGYRGVYFSAGSETLYAVNYRSRLINRVLAPLISFKCHSDRYLYSTARQIEWRDFMDNGHTFAVFASVSNSHIRHSKYAALKLKDAIVDSFREKTGQRPSVDTREPDIWFNLHIESNRAVISVDCSGGSLHRRGYRLQSVQAPMAETVAASIIRLSEWGGNSPLYDPFCGSGTLLCEAFLRAANIPSSFMREKFGFQRLPDFDATLWKKVQREARKRIVQPRHGLIKGSDIDAGAVQAAQINCRVIDPKKVITIRRRDIFEIDEIKEQTIVCNPPYGLRMGKKGSMADFYKQLGDFLKQRCTGSTAFIYFGKREYLKKIGLRSSWKRPLQNGGLDGRLARFDLY